MTQDKETKRASGFNGKEIHRIKEIMRRATHDLFSKALEHLVLKNTLVAVDGPAALLAGDGIDQVFADMSESEFMFSIMSEDKDEFVERIYRVALRCYLGLGPGEGERAPELLTRAQFDRLRGTLSSLEALIHNEGMTEAEAMLITVEIDTIIEVLAKYSEPIPTLTATETEVE